MKYLMLSIVVMIFVISCNDDKIVITKEEYAKLKGVPVRPEYPKDIRIDNISNANYYHEGLSTNAHILVVDSCEYIYMEREGDGGPAITHKGNCKFCIQRNEKLLKEYLNTIYHIQQTTHE